MLTSVANLFALLGLGASEPQTFTPSIKTVWSIALMKEITLPCGSTHYVTVGSQRFGRFESFSPESVLSNCYQRFEGFLSEIQEQNRTGQELQGGGRLVLSVLVSSDKSKAVVSKADLLAKLQPLLQDVRTRGLAMEMQCLHHNLHHNKTRDRDFC